MRLDGVVDLETMHGVRYGSSLVFTAGGLVQFCGTDGAAFTASGRGYLTGRVFQVSASI